MQVRLFFWWFWEIIIGLLTTQRCNFSVSFWLVHGDGILFLPPWFLFFWDYHFLSSTWMEFVLSLRLVGMLCALTSTLKQSKEVTSTLPLQPACGYGCHCQHKHFLDRSLPTLFHGVFQLRRTHNVHPSWTSWSCQGQGFHRSSHTGPQACHLRPNLQYPRKGVHHRC